MNTWLSQLVADSAVAEIVVHDRTTGLDRCGDLGSAESGALTDGSKLYRVPVCVLAVGHDGQHSSITAKWSRPSVQGSDG